MEQALCFSFILYFSRAADWGLKRQVCFSIWVYSSSHQVINSSYIVNHLQLLEGCTDIHCLWTLAFCWPISTFLYPTILIYEHTCSRLFTLSQPRYNGSVVFHPTCTHSLLIRVDRCLDKISPEIIALIEFAVPGERTSFNYY